MFAAFFEHLRRKSNARRFGVPYARGAVFQMPGTMQLRGQTVRLAAPHEQGACDDFVRCLLSDAYGLKGIDFRVKTIADVGANVGFFALAARARFAKARIQCYEPNPRVHPFLFQNTAPAKAEVFTEAVGAQEGWARVLDHGAANAATTEPAEAGGHSIRQVSLAVVVARAGGRVDLAKINCEGAEWELLGDPEPWAHIGHVRMEYHLPEGRSFADLSAALQGLGFRLERHRAEGNVGTIFARNRAG